MNAAVEISHQALEQLEFHKLREFLAGYARGEEGRLACLNLHPLTDITFLDDRQDQVDQLMSLMNLPGRPQLQSYGNIADALMHLAVDGYVLGQEDLHEIGRQMEQVETLHRFFAKPDHQRDFPAIADWRLRAIDPVKLIKALRLVLDETGQVKPDASPLLLEISRSIDSENARLGREFARLITRYREEGWLSDPPESVRSGRRVLCVKSEFKRKVGGIMHDESATGRTTFIEPEAIVGINNRIIELEGEYKKEVYRLLRELCNYLRPFKPELDQIADLMHYWDLMQAIAQLATQYRGTRPKLQKEPVLHLLQARHPLLYIKNKTRQKAVVPFDLVLHPPNRLLILSGPNAGGKSILMKAAGLIQVMAQCGMPVPADGSTTVGIAHRMSVDIGDQQSIEEDLSTYSSRLRNMKETLEHADSKTMILVDEFGSGTDPKIGGAIAEAILDALVKKKAFGVITTHYPNIKMYAHRTKGVVNGAMMFDREKIEPTYTLKIGKPGSSFAFEIAERTGLPDSVIAYARKKAGQQAVEMEDLIHDLDTNRIRLDADLKSLDIKQRELDRLMAGYEQMSRDLELQRKKLKIERKQSELIHLSQLEQQLKERLKVEAEAEAKEQAARRKEKPVKAESIGTDVLKGEVKAMKSIRQEVIGDLKILTEELAEITHTDHQWAVGDYVRLASTSETGVIEKITRDKAIVTIGQLQMTLPLSQLLPAKQPLDIKSERSVQRQTSDYSKFENELDIRGMTPEEALRFLERFIDAALMSRHDRIRIVHGKGTGALRRLVINAMKSHKFREVYHPAREEGGDGVTIGVI